LSLIFVSPHTAEKNFQRIFLCWVKHSFGVASKDLRGLDLPRPARWRLAYIYSTPVLGGGNTQLPITQTASTAGGHLSLLRPYRRVTFAKI